MASHNDVHGAPVLPQMIEGMDPDLILSLGSMIEFVGPMTGRIGDVPYITFVQYGVKAEGESPYPDDETRCWTQAEAVWRFRKAFVEYLLAHPSSQIAWRRKPTAEQNAAGDWVVTCRFALLGQIHQPLQAVA